MRCLTEQGYSFTCGSEREIPRDIKETLSYVALDFAKEMARPHEEIQRENELPDSNVINVGGSRFRSAEPIFDPVLCGKEGDGVHQLVWKALQVVDCDVIGDMMANIVLSGGNTMFDGLAERLQADT